MTAKKSNRKEVKIKPEEVPHKGHDFPKTNIPDELEKTSKGKKTDERPSLWDKIGLWLKTIPEIIGKAFNTIPSIREVKTVAYLLLAIFVLFGLFKILGWI